MRAPLAGQGRGRIAQALGLDAALVTVWWIHGGKMAVEVTAPAAVHTVIVEPGEHWVDDALRELREDMAGERTS